MERIDCLKMGSEIHRTVKIKVLVFIENNKDETILNLRNYIHGELLRQIDETTYEKSGLKSVNTEQITEARLQTKNTISRTYVTQLTNHNKQGCEKHWNNEYR